MRVKQLAYLSGGGKGLLSSTIGDALRLTAQRHPGTEALVVQHEGVRWTYKEFLERTEAIAEGLVGLGLPAQSRVGIFAPNNKEWVLLQFAASLADLILVNVNPAYQLLDLEYALQKVGVHTLVMTSSNRNTSYVELMRNLVPELDNGKWTSERLPDLKNIIVIGNEKFNGMMNFDELYDIKSNEYKNRTLHVNFESATNIQFTSGTTGKPKAATLTHHNILNNGYYIGNNLKYTHHDRVCIPVPLYHCFGMVLGNLACITHGATMVYPDANFNAEATMDTVESEKCTALYGVPTMFVKYLVEQDKKPRKVDTLRTGIVAGSVCTAELMKRILDDLNIKEMTNCYGMTETSPVSFQSPLNSTFEKRISSVGKIHPHVEAKIIGPSGENLEIGETGELCTRGYLVMEGYWGDNKATQDSIDRDGWMHTGDLAIFDHDGYCKIMGRNKDMIIRGGENIYPSEIEDYLQAHPDIEDAHVIGIPDEVYGEEVCAWIKMREGRKDLTKQDIKEFLEHKIAHYKIPKVIRIVEGFPFTVSGKVQKNIMREEHKVELKRL